jgi:hypothetical protein
MLTGGPDLSQGVFIVEDTTLPPSPLPGARCQVSGARRTHPNGLLAEPEGARHIAIR